MRSKLDPMKKVAATLRRQRELLLNWFRAHGDISSGVVEGFNTKAKLTSRNPYGFRSTEALQIARYQHVAGLPESNFTQEFC
jgi:transposase